MAADLEAFENAPCLRPVIEPQSPLDGRGASANGGKGGQSEWGFIEAHWRKAKADNSD
jgi:hypothetical protein